MIGECIDRAFDVASAMPFPVGFFILTLLFAGVVAVAIWPLEKHVDDPMAQPFGDQPRMPSL